MKSLLEMIKFLTEENEKNQKRMALLELNVDKLLRNHRTTVNPMLLRHETSIHRLEYKLWWKRLFGL